MACLSDVELLLQKRVVYYVHLPCVKVIQNVGTSVG